MIQNAFDSIKESLKEAEEKKYVSVGDFPDKDHREAILAIEQAQNKINEIECRLEAEMKEWNIAKKTAVSVVEKGLLELKVRANVMGVRINNILIFLKKKPSEKPSYDDVYKKIKQTAPDIAKTMQEAYDALDREIKQKPEQFTTAVKSDLVKAQEMKEAIDKVKDILTFIKDKVSSAFAILGNIEYYLGIEKPTVGLSEAVENDENVFTSNVKVDYFNVRGLPEDVYLEKQTKDLRLTYRIEMEYRTWGIHGVEVHFLDTPLEIAYKVYRGEGDEEAEEQVVKVSFEDAEIDWVEGDGIYPRAVGVEINQDGGILRSMVEMAYWVPNR